MRFLAKRVIAQVIGYSADELVLSPQRNQSLTLVGVHGQRLFAHHMLAGIKRRCGLGAMEVIWRTDMYHIDRTVTRQLVERTVSTLQPQCGSCFFRPLG